MDLDTLFSKLDYNKIPNDQKEGFKLAMLRLWKTTTGAVIPVSELKDEHITKIMEGYYNNKFVSVADFIDDPGVSGIPNIWIDILTEELRRRYHGTWN